MILLVPFVAALAFSGHCALMCGVFPAAVRAGSGHLRRALIPQALYHAGKISTYVFLGAAAAAAGLRVDALRMPLGLLSAALLFLVGAATLAPAALPQAASRWIRGSPLCAILADLLRRPGRAAALLTGVFNGFIPCGLVYAMAARAATLGSAAAGAASMLAFGLGTVPALLVVGLAVGEVPARFRSGTARRRLAWAAGATCLILGGVTLAAALGAPVHRHALR
ncbi:MAG: sulfite exporter TauE/SafE family protein [Acidobacteria bacterium]|nr:sulfite exporter TauE/SafE family protein [Acidobacteriota bacterium]